jgi:hypothetical protein
MIVDKLDQEFKLFMRWRGVNIDSQLFDLTFEEPQNFAQYRQADIDSARIATFAQLEPFPYMSKRYLMKRYLGMSEQEMSENETMWAEEQGEVSNAPAEDPSLRNVGISPGGIASDLDNVAPPAESEAMPGEAPGATQGMSPMGGPQPGAGAPAAAAPMV